MNKQDYKLVVDIEFKKILRNLSKNKKDILYRLDKQIDKIKKNPELGKPLRNILKNHRRIHVYKSFVLIYEIKQDKVRLVDFDHHDVIYKKH